MKKILSFRKRAHLVLVLQLIFISSLSAEIRYVSKTGLSIPPYTSWENAADSIQKCIDISNSGDTIYVANGTYVEAIIIKRGVALIGSGIDSCLIDTRSIVTASGFNAVTIRDSCRFRDFKIIVSNGWWGTAINNWDSVSPDFFSTVENCFIENAKNGVLTGTSITFKNNVVQNCEIGVKIMAISNSVYPTIIGNYFSVWTCIHISFGSTPYFGNNIFKGYKAFTGSYSGKNEFYNNLFFVEEGLSFSDTTIFVNNVLTGNIGEALQVAPNNIIKNNAVCNASVVFLATTPINPIIKYNNIWNYNLLSNGHVPLPDSTNTFNDPMFAQDTSDFHLQLYSRLINAGDPSILDEDSSRSDIGMFGGPLGESYTYQDLAPRVPLNVSAEYDTIQIKLTWNKNTESDFSDYRIYRDTTADFHIDSTKLISTSKDTFLVQNIPIGINAIYYKITAVDSQENESLPSEEVAVIISSTDNNEPTLVYDYRLYQNYPNPFNPSTKIGYRLTEKGYVKLMVYNLNGELVRILVNGQRDRGYYEEEFRADELASGIYVFRIDIISETKTPAYSDVKKMILIK